MLPKALFRLLNSTPHSRAEEPLAVISGKGIHVHMDDLEKLVPCAEWESGKWSVS